MQQEQQWMDYNLLKTFIKVSELGSFSKAAKALNQPKSRISRAIARVENELGVELIRRTTRKVSLTSVGQDFYHTIYPLLSGVDEELIKVSSRQQEMSGVIRLTAPLDIGQSLLGKIISVFNEKYPDVQVETIITNDFLDLVEENIDLSIRAGRLRDSSLIQKKLMSVSFIIVCTEAYLQKYGRPTELKDLEKHKFLSFRDLTHSWLGKDIKLRPFVKSDSIPMLLNMTLNSDGIAVLPDYFCKDLLTSNTLIRLFPSWKSKANNVHILYPSSKNSSKKIKAFIETAINAI